MLLISPLSRDRESDKRSHTNDFPCTSAPDTDVISPFLKPPSSASSIEMHPVLTGDAFRLDVRISQAANSSEPNVTGAGNASVGTFKLAIVENSESSLNSKP